MFPEIQNESSTPIWLQNQGNATRLPAGLWGACKSYGSDRALFFQNLSRSILLAVLLAKLKHSIDDPSSDPLSNANNDELLQGTKDASVCLLNGVRIPRPKDKPAQKDIIKPYPYREFMLKQITPTRPFPPLETEDLTSILASQISRPRTQKQAGRRARASSGLVCGSSGNIPRNVLIRRNRW
jgi:hypothetical protein